MVCHQAFFDKEYITSHPEDTEKITQLKDLMQEQVRHFITIYTCSFIYKPDFGARQKVRGQLKSLGTILSNTSSTKQFSALMHSLTCQPETQLKDLMQEQVRHYRTNYSCSFIYKSKYGFRP